MSDGRLVLIEIKEREDELLLRSQSPLHLLGSTLRLNTLQRIRWRGDRAEIQSYQYRLQESDARDSWLLRWEYFRRRPKPDYAYPLAHVHINASFVSSGAARHLTKPPAHLHVPTRRLPLEAVLWHLIAEWDVASRRDDWREYLDMSIEGFEQRRHAP